jgi:hypothetical protein
MKKKNKEVRIVKPIDAESQLERLRTLREISSRFDGSWASRKLALLNRFSQEEFVDVKNLVFYHDCLLSY